MKGVQSPLSRGKGRLLRGCSAAYIRSPNNLVSEAAPVDVFSLLCYIERPLLECDGASSSIELGTGPNTMLG